MAIRFSGRDKVKRGAVPLQRAETHPELAERNAAGHLPCPASPPDRFSGYHWNLGFVLVLIGAVLGLFFTLLVLFETLPRSDLNAPHFEVLDIKVNWFSLPPIIGGICGALIFLLWAGRTRITVDDFGIEVEGAILHTVIPWSDIEAFSIRLSPGRRAPSKPLYTIHRRSGRYEFLVDLPRGTRRRLCEAIEARGIKTSNSYFVWISPLFGLLLFGFVTATLLTRL